MCSSVAAFVVASALPAFAQTPPTTTAPTTVAADDDDKLEPDRPDVTNSTHIVDDGLLQIELGGIFNRPDSTHKNAGTPITFRVGLTDWLEIRAGADGFLFATDPDGSVSGPGNVQVGAKLRLWADPGGIPVLSILPTINLPAASESKGLGSGDADYTVALLTGADVFKHGHVDINYGIGLIGAGSGQPHFVQHLVSLSGSVEIPGPVTPYVESFWFSRQEADGTRVVAIDAGGIYVINPRLALDGGFQGGLTEQAPAWSVFGGISIVVGNILGDHGVHARQREAARRRAFRARGK